MTVEQVCDTLENAGFDVTPYYPYLIVSLNRAVSKTEVWAALNCNYDIDKMERVNGKVWVKC